MIRLTYRIFNRAVYSASPHATVVVAQRIARSAYLGTGRLLSGLNARRKEAPLSEANLLKVVTPEYSPGMVNEPLLDTLPVREVDDFSAVEAVFEETAQGGPPVGLMGGSGQSASVGTNLGEIELGNGGEGEAEEFPDLPPGGIALVLIIAGGFALSTAGLAPNSPVFLVGVVMASGGVLIFAWAGVIYKTKGWAEAQEFLVTVDEDTAESTSSDTPEKTPPFGGPRALLRSPS